MEQHITKIHEAVIRLGRSWRGSEAGMTTAEYAVGTIAACTFALVLLGIVKSGPVRTMLTDVITSALGLAG